jgi:CTD kinase subunit beta
MSTPSTPHDTPHTPNEKPFPSMIKLTRPFLSLSQIEALENASGVKGPSATQMRVQAFNLVLSVAENFKLPMKTIATTMYLFLKNMLHNQTSKTPINDIVIACMMVASKIEDTPKKAKELIPFVYSIKHINLSSTQVEEVKSQVLGLERQILETLGFDFRITHPHSYVIKLSKSLGLSQKTASMAWKMATDLCMTQVSMKAPAHSAALACVLLAERLQAGQRLEEGVRDHHRHIVSTRSIDDRDIRALCRAKDVNIALLDLLDFYIHYLNFSQLGKQIHEVSKFMTIRISVNQELSKDGISVERRTKSNDLALRDARISDKGTVRYILDWEKDHCRGEVLS